TRFSRDWSSDVCSSDLEVEQPDDFPATRPLLKARPSLEDGQSRLAQRRHQCEVIMVPTPWSVRISSSRQCGTRPSTMWTEFTPLRAASRAEEILGSMPPEIVPSAKRE